MKINTRTGWLKSNKINFAQNRHELQWLVDKAIEINAETIVEIGSREGGSIYVLGGVPSVKRVICIDLPNSLWGWDKSDDNLRIVHQQLTQEGTQAECILLDSHDPHTVKLLKDHFLQDTPIDLLFIDGDHTYEGCLQDYKTYSPLVRPGGIVALHDIASPPPKHDPPMGVPQVWQEISQGMRQDSCIKGKIFGIGVIYL